MSAKYALIIGNGEYLDSGLAQLNAPGRDANDLADVLKDKEIGAFDDVNILLNQPSSSIIEAIDAFFDQKKPDDLLVLYFSGHGVRDEHGSLYLAVKNTNRNRLRSTAIKSDYIREVMDQSRSRRQVLILDCCNSGAFSQGTKAATGVSIGTASAFEGGYGRIILTASDSTQYAWEGDKVIGETDNSLFTHYLVEGLKGEADIDSDGRITVDELYDFAYEKVRLATPKQTPSKFSSKQQGEIILRANIRIEDTKVIPLPDDLMAAVKSSLPFVREGAVKQLELLLKGRNRALARSAQSALEKMVSEDDSRSVSQAAERALEAVRGVSESTPDTLQVSRKQAETQEIVEEIKRSEVEKLAPQKSPPPSLPKWALPGLIGIGVLAALIWGASSYFKPAEKVSPQSAPTSAIVAETPETEVTINETVVPTQISITPSVPEVLSLPVLEGLTVPVGSNKITPSNFGNISQLALWGRGTINQVIYSPDGKIFAAATSYGAYIFDAKTFSQIKLIEPNTYIIALAFSSDSKTLASASWDNTIKLWDVKEGTLIRTLEGHSADVTCLAFSSSEQGEILASGSLDNSIRIWDAEDGELLKTLRGHTSPIRALAISPNGKTLATGSDDKSIRLWDIANGTLTQTLGGHTDSVLAVAYSQDGSMLASGSADNTIRTWSTTDGSLLETSYTYSGSVNSIAFSPDGYKIVAGLEEHSIRLMDIYGYNVMTLSEHTEPVTGVSFSPDGTVLASSSIDNTIRLWDFSLVNNYPVLQTLGGASSGVYSISYSPDGQILAGGSTDKSIRIWRTTDGVLLKTLTGHNNAITSLAFSPDGKIIATGSEDKTVRLWYINEGGPPLTLGGHQGRINEVKFSPDGTMLASASEDESIRIWNVSDGALLFTLLGYGNPTDIAFSPDGMFLFACNGGYGFETWDLDTRNTIGFLEFTNGEPLFLDISPDGETLAISLDFHSIDLVDISSGDVTYSLEVSSNVNIYRVTFSSDGNMIAASSTDDKIYLWDANKGTFIGTLEGHTEDVTDIDFSPDGKTFASASFDGTVRIWGIEK